jgi:predicted phosphodiesterase
LRVALISDIHANLPALEAVLADLARRGDVTAVYHLGDLVGYAPWPNEVVAAIRAANIAGVAGNYDSTTGAGYKHCGCRYEDPRQEALSHLSYAWTLRACSVETKGYLAGLPFRLDVRHGGGHASGPTLVLVHGTPTLNTVYWTEDRSDDFCRQMAAHAGLRPGDVIAFGHTHLPWHRVVDGIHFVNAGSVGRPKDGDPRAGYTLLSLNDETLDIQHVRVAYDVERAASAIRESDMPNEFAEYLLSGGRRLDPADAVRT